MTNYYRTTILYKGEGKPYHNTSGGNIIVSATDEEDARSIATKTFKGVLAAKGFGDVEFVLEIYKISMDEIEHFLKNNSKGMVQ
jgi:hypothetical protein